jgi:hypothetical protein
LNLGQLAKNADLCKLFCDVDEMTFLETAGNITLLGDRRATKLCIVCSHVDRKKRYLCVKEKT